MTTATRLLLTERDALLPILTARPAADFDLPTVLPGWSVRDVLAHCSAALGMVAAGTAHGFTPAENEVDIAHRRNWPIAKLLDELAGGYTDAAAAIGAAAVGSGDESGPLDGIALGEWTHGGDVRDAWGIDDAYASAGIDEAISLLVTRSRGPRSTLPPTAVTLRDFGPVRLGTAAPVATLQTDTATFVRMVAGRSPDPGRFTLTGAEPAQYVIFR